MFASQRMLSTVCWPQNLWQTMSVCFCLTCHVFFHISKDSCSHSEGWIVFKIDSHESNSSPAGLGFYEKVRRFLPVSKSLEMAFFGRRLDGVWLHHVSRTHSNQAADEPDETLAGLYCRNGWMACRRNAIYWWNFEAKCSRLLKDGNGMSFVLKRRILYWMQCQNCLVLYPLTILEFNLKRSYENRKTHGL